MLRRSLLTLWLLSSAAGPATAATAAAADAAALITIVEGEAQIIRGATRLLAAEGVRLAWGDIVETAEGAFAQVELADTSVLQLGGGARAWLTLAGARGAKPMRSVYGLAGWFKLAAPRQGTASLPIEFRSPWVDVALWPASAVLLLKGNEVTVFAERGEARLVEPTGGKGGAPLVVKAGDYYRRAAGARGNVAPKAPAGFIDSLPRAFRDSLPLRAAKFGDREVVARRGAELAYADVEAWLKADRELRRPLVERFRAKAGEPAFRAGLVANMGAHPEWDRILFPEKYLPPVAASATPR